MTNRAPRLLKHIIHTSNSTHLSFLSHPSTPAHCFVAVSSPTNKNKPKHTLPLTPYFLFRSDLNQTSSRTAAVLFHHSGSQFFPTFPSSRLLLLFLPPLRWKPSLFPSAPRHRSILTLLAAVLRLLPSSQEGFLKPASKKISNTPVLDSKN